MGFGAWLYTIVAFAFPYRVLDGGGPAPPGWHPQFSGYLYLGFTKATMALQAVGSLAILGLVIARAVNILR